MTATTAFVLWQNCNPESLRFVIRCVCVCVWAGWGGGGGGGNVRAEISLRVWVKVAAILLLFPWILSAGVLIGWSSYFVAFWLAEAVILWPSDWLKLLFFDVLINWSCYFVTQTVISWCPDWLKLLFCDIVIGSSCYFVTFWLAQAVELIGCPGLCITTQFCVSTRTHTSVTFNNYNK